MSSLLPGFRQQNRQVPYQDVLNAMDYAESHYQVLEALDYELHHCSNEAAKSRIKDILESFSSANEYKTSTSQH